ncbi:MAG TPA: 3',5'-cyclic-nucleotide phosphodiesterase [Polyangiales bacterium]|nr:3',5'-cyclic-nucleotide phosphodiesterase [Polyangiales bacterium]
MEFKVLGCHGGESPKHQCPAFLLDGRVCLDAGSITNMLTLKEQQRIETVLVSHAHLDHVRDLAMLSDTRTQQGGPPLVIASTPGTIAVLKKHFFNDKLWPDFSKIPFHEKATVVFQALKPEVESELSGYRVRPVPVDHSVEAAAFLVGDGESVVCYSGDTGPTERLWNVLQEQPNLRALVMEVAFPNEQAKLASDSCHHTPKSLEAELKKLGVKKRDIPVLLFHIKPVFQEQTERQLAKLKTRNTTILNIGDQYLL